MIIRHSLCTPLACEAKLGSATQCCFREHLESFWGASPEHCPGFGFKQKANLLAYFHICAHYLLKGKAHTVLPPVDRVGEPNLEKWSTVTSRVRVPGYSHQWALSYFLSLFPTEFGLSCPKRCLWSCHTLLCQSDSSTFGLGPLKWWTVMVFPLNAHLMPILGALHLHLIYMLDNFGWKFSITLACEPCFI